MIDISLYGIPKADGNGNAGTKYILYGSDGKLFEPHYLWGQYFDDTKDIDGDMKVNGTIRADYIETIQIDAERGNIEDIKGKDLEYENGRFTYLKGIAADFDFASILKGYIGELSSKNITTENLTVTKSAHFFELIIDQIKASGGAVLFTPANGFTIRKAEKKEGFWRLYFLANERGQKIRNMWRKNDQAICQNFNRAAVGTSYNISNKYYWSLVVNTNNDELNGNAVIVNVGTSENIDMQECHYIDISDEDYDGSLEPEEGDEVAMLGYRGNDDKARQNAIYISSYASLDTDLKAPLIVQYKGINEFSLANHKYTWFSGGTTPQGEANGISENEIRGSFKVTDGRTIEDYIEDNTKNKTYRIIPNISSIIRDSEGKTSTDLLKLSIIENDKGNASIYTFVPYGTYLEIYYSKNSIMKLMDTLNQEKPLSINLNENFSQFDSVIFMLRENITKKTLDRCEVSISDVDTSNTVMDRLLDMGSIGIIDYKGDANGYYGQYEFSFKIFHYDGDTITDVNGSTNPDYSGYEVESYFVNSKGKELNLLKTSNLAEIYDGQKYVVKSEEYKWDKEENNFTFCKLLLKKDGKTVDTIVMMIGLSSKATLEVIQGESAKILATVTGFEGSMNESFTEMSNMINELMITADETSSIVKRHTTEIDNLTGELSEKVTWSYIIQHADEIDLGIQEGLMNTGINIQTGQITLNSENTTINGNLNLRSKNNSGMIIYDSENNPRISIQPRSAGKRLEFEFKENIYLGSNDNSPYTYDMKNTYDIEVGNVKAGTKVDLNGNEIHIKGAKVREGSNVGWAMSSDIPSNLEVSLELRNSSNAKIYDYGKWTIGKNNGKYNFPSSLKMSSAFADNQGKCHLHMEVELVYGLGESHYDRWCINFITSTVVDTPSLTFIGTDAIVRGKSKDCHAWLGDDEFMLRWHDMSLPHNGTTFAVGSYGFQRSCGYDFNTHQAQMIQFDSYIPCKELNYSTDLGTYYIYTGKDQRTVKGYKLDTNDSGFIIIPWNFRAVDGDIYIILYSGFSDWLGTNSQSRGGRRVMIKNLSNKTVYVVDGQQGMGILHRDNLGYESRYSIGNASCTFMSIPQFPITGSGTQGWVGCRWMCLNQG